MTPHLRKRFRRACYTTVIASAVVSTEVTGYNAFDLISDFNVACSIDPTCRKLTDDEIDFAREYYGDQIDYSSVNYFTRPPMWGMGGGDNTLAVSALGNIYEVNNNFYNNTTQVGRDNIFIHEMMHVWQYQNGHTPKFSNHDHEHDNTYEYDIYDFDAFMDFGTEQQGVIMQSIHADRFLLENANLQNTMGLDFWEICQSLNKHEEIAAQELPIEITQCDAPPITVPEI